MAIVVRRSPRSLEAQNPACVPTEAFFRGTVSGFQPRGRPCSPWASTSVWREFARESASVSASVSTIVGGRCSATRCACWTAVARSASFVDSCRAMWSVSALAPMAMTAAITTTARWVCFLCQLATRSMLSSYHVFSASRNWSRSSPASRRRDWRAPRSGDWVAEWNLPSVWHPCSARCQSLPPNTTNGCFLRPLPPHGAPPWVRSRESQSTWGALPHSPGLEAHPGRT